MSEEIEIRHPEDEIAAKVAALAARLDGRLRGEELLVVGILKGCIPFVPDLVRRLATPCRFEFIDVERRDGADSAGEPNISIRFFRHFRLEKRHVLIVKDVVATGVVETYLLGQLRMQRPKSLALACVVDRPGDRRVDLEVDEALFLDDLGERWVGYGLCGGDGAGAQRGWLGVENGAVEG